MNIVFPKFDDFNEHAEASITSLIDGLYDILLNKLIKCNNNPLINADTIKTNFVFDSYKQYIPKSKKEYIGLNLYYNFFDHVIDISCVIHYQHNGDVYYTQNSKSHFFNYSHNKLYNSPILDILNINHFKSLNTSCAFEIDLTTESQTLYKISLIEYLKLSPEINKRFFVDYYFNQPDIFSHSVYRFKSCGSSCEASYPSKGISKIEDVVIYLQFLKAYCESPEYVASSAINYYCIDFSDDRWVNLLENIFIRHYANRREELLQFIHVYDMLTI